MSDSLPYIIVGGIFAIVLVWLLITKTRKHKLKLSILKNVFNLSTEAESVRKEMANSEEVEKIENGSNEAVGLMRWLSERFDGLDGKYILTESTDDNARIAAQLYTRLTGVVIGTAFFEEPYYGKGDYARTIREGTKFYRLTLEQNTTESVISSVQETFSTFSCDAKLIVVPKDEEISKMGGVFAKLPDDSCIVFISMNNYELRGDNRGLVFTGNMADNLFRYYYGLAKAIENKQKS